MLRISLKINTRKDALEIYYRITMKKEKGLEKLFNPLFFSG